nr:hypothetical protein [Tanacetum cinerariifolium]
MTSFAKPAHSNVKRSFQRKSADKNQPQVPRIPTVDSKFPTAKSTLTADLGNKEKAVKASACWIWRPKQNTTEQVLLLSAKTWLVLTLLLNPVKKTRKKISIQGSDVAGFDKLKVKCFNCYKMGYFARECRAPRSQDKGRRDNYRQGSKAEDQAPNALMAIDGVGWDWSYMTNDKEDHALVTDEVASIEFALMANTSAESKVFDNSLCSNDCKKNNDSLNSKITDLTDKLFDAKNMIYHYKLGLAQVETRLVEYKEREVKYCEKIKTLEFRNGSNNECIEILKKKIETLKKEKEGVDGKLAGLLTASKNLDNLIESQMSDKKKDGLGYSAVPPTPTQLYSSPKKDFS